ncbi:response regulator [Flaviaesturariibacter aridisoli]|uniref:Response regulator n=1 Tax=Flaviaesturariibacter aridisoli TaxID=2545761 RepID=A0A4R4DXV5_9BACT|nr:response regulator [Flaviaesturariibacter aridisoli]TCZ70134.1 response regulator [Flaviaesturariibacter aridisoli]
MTNQNSKPTFLYAEDDLDDYEALKEALAQITDKYELAHAKNGSEVIEYLEGGHGPRPCLIVLDLNMPIMDGKETLLWLKGQPSFDGIPTMVFTTSSREEDIKLCQSHNCTFFRKPTLYRDLLHVVQIMLQMCGEPKG